MSQFLRPAQDITVTSFTGTPTNTAGNRYTNIDEETPSDSDYVYGAGNSSTAQIEVLVNAPGETPEIGTCTVRWRGAKVSGSTLDGGGGTVLQTVFLVQGADAIATSSAENLTGSWTSYSFTFDSSIVTTWNDLRLRFTQTGSGGGPNARGSAASWAEIEVPNAASPSSEVIQDIIGLGIIPFER